MTLPIQAPSIDRANRAINFSINAPSRGITAQKITFGDVAGVACEACSLLPFPVSLVCRALCKGVTGQL